MYYQIFIIEYQIFGKKYKTIKTHLVYSAKYSIKFTKRLKIFIMRNQIFFYLVPNIYCQVPNIYYTEPNELKVFVIY